MSLTHEQVVDLVQQLPPEQKRLLLLSLAREAQNHQVERMASAEARLRVLAAERGKVWDSLDEDEREAFIDTLLHEDD